RPALPTACLCVVFFFFQAEDGIRDRNVTGVQTCALPISEGEPFLLEQPLTLRAPELLVNVLHIGVGEGLFVIKAGEIGRVPAQEIGRASCRERVEMGGMAV